MNSMCDQFFAGAAFTGNEDRHIERGNLPDLALEPADRIAFADNLLQAERPLPKTRQLFLVVVNFSTKRRNLAAQFMHLLRCLERHTADRSEEHTSELQSLM